MTRFTDNGYYTGDLFGPRRPMLLSDALAVWLWAWALQAAAVIAPQRWLLLPGGAWRHRFATCLNSAAWHWWERKEGRL